jgi:hypothetical protein
MRGYFVLGMEIASLFNFSSEYENTQKKSKGKYDAEFTNHQRRDLLFLFYKIISNLKL